MNKFIKMLKQQKAEKMGKVVLKQEVETPELVNDDVISEIEEEVETPEPNPKAKRKTKAKSDGN